MPNPPPDDFDYQKEEEDFALEQDIAARKNASEQAAMKGWQYNPETDDYTDQDGNRRSPQGKIE